MKKNTNLNIRISPEMKARIQAAAEASDVSVSAWLLMAAQEEIMDKDAHVHMRIPGELKDAAVAAANADNRTLSSWLETLIRRELAHSEVTRRSVEQNYEVRYYSDKPGTWKAE